MCVWLSLTSGNTQGTRAVVKYEIWALFSQATFSQFWNQLHVYVESQFTAEMASRRYSTVLLPGVDVSPTPLSLGFIPVVMVTSHRLSDLNTPKWGLWGRTVPGVCVDLSVRGTWTRNRLLDEKNGSLALLVWTLLSELCYVHASNNNNNCFFGGGSRARSRLVLNVKCLFQ